MTVILPSDSYPKIVGFGPAVEPMSRFSLPEGALAAASALYHNLRRQSTAAHRDVREAGAAGRLLRAAAPMARLGDGRGTMVVGPQPGKEAEVMFRPFSKLGGHRLHATDGEIGSVSDLYFSDNTWDVRYLVVDIGSWLAGRTVLLVPQSLELPARVGDPIRVRLTRDQIRQSPDIDTAKPVSRQHEEALHSYFGWPPYWGGGGIGSDHEEYGEGINPALTGTDFPATSTGITEEVESEEAEGDPHLRSATELDGYHIHARDGEIGSVSDLLVDDRDWRVRYLIVRPGGWLSGRHVLISPQWIREVSWVDSSVYVDLDRGSIKNAPPFDPSRELTREDEERLHRHYGRAPYWA
jgi:sporulation protein YlmC with PRC-barrel domain